MGVGWGGSPPPWLHGGPSTNVRASAHPCPLLPPLLCPLPTGVEEQSGRQDLMGRKQDEVGGGESWIFFPFFFFFSFFFFFFFFFFSIFWSRIIVY